MTKNIFQCLIKYDFHLTNSNSVISCIFDTTESYYKAFLDLQAEGDDIKEADLVEAFINGIHILATRSSIKLLKKTTLFENFELLETIYEKSNSSNEVANFARHNNNRSSGRYNNNNRNGYNGNRNNNNRNSGNNSNASNWRNNNRNNNNNNRNNNFKQNSNNSNNRDDSNITCLYCDKKGHKIAKCRALKAHKKTPQYKANMVDFKNNFENGDGNYSDDDFDEDEDVEGRELPGSSTRNTNYVFGVGVNNLNSCDSRTQVSQDAKTLVSVSKPLHIANFSNVSHKHGSMKNESCDGNTRWKLNKSIHPKLHTIDEDFTVYKVLKNNIIHIYKTTVDSLVRYNFKIHHKFSNQWSPAIDSGCTRSVITKNTAEKLGAKICTNFNFTVTGFDGQSSGRILGYIDQIRVEIPGLHKSVTISPIVVDHEGSDLCGLDVIEAAGGGSLTLGENGKLHWNFLCSSSEKHPNTDSFKIKSAETIEIQPGFIKTIKIIPPKPDTDFIVQSRKKKNLTLLTLDGIVDKNVEKICICNVSANKMIVQKGQHISNAFLADNKIDKNLEENLDKIGEIPKGNSQKLTDQEIFKKIKEKTRHISDLSTRAKLQKILKENISVFDIGSEKVGLYRHEVSINPHNKDIKVKPEKRRTFNRNTWGKINIKLDELKDANLIEPCLDPRISPANLVPAKRKGSDEIRLCVDYKRLNEEICHNFFPLPNTDELFSSFSSASADSLFVKLDISSCFHNFKLAYKDRYLTCFYTEKGVWQWVRLPFGIKSAPGIVQQAMTDILWSNDLKLDPSTNRDIFIDDILVMFKNIEKSLPDIENLLKHLNQSGLKLKFSKCEFLKNKVEYMGTHLNTSSSGVQVSADPKNIEALQNLKKPHDSKSLKSFLGLCGWIAKHIKNIHLEMGPLFNIVSKLNRDKDKSEVKPKIKFATLWTKDIDNLYNHIIKIVSKPKTLSVPDYTKQFFIEADASQSGFGAMIYQEGPDSEKNVVAYASKALSKQAANYENIHRETACATWAVEKFHRFFCCSPHPTIVWTDNRVTSFIRNATSSKLKRWRIMLDSYNIILKYKPGRTQEISDALSRLIRNGKTGDYERDISDEILEEVVIASAVGADNVELYQLHVKHGHLGADKLSKLTNFSRDKCDQVIKRCFHCLAKSKVIEYKQILGTIQDNKKKNDIWMSDFVFSKDKKKYVSVLDRSTRFFMASKVNNREHKNIIKTFSHMFRTMGRPRVIVADREFISKDLENFLTKNDVKLCPLTRESPWLNILERYHREIKVFANEMF